MSITHTFTDFLPSIFLGSPDEDSALSVLPGHKLLQQGRGYEAILLTIYGSIIGIFIILFFIPIFIFLLPKIYPHIQKLMFFILIAASFFLIIKEKNKFLAIIIFLLAGILGVLTLNLPIKNSLLPLLTGLFGASTLPVSIMQKTKIKKQAISKPKIKTKSIIKSILPSFIASPLVSFLPSLGASQAAIISLGMKKKSEQKNPKEFLILLGSINTIVMGLSFITLYSINKARTGSAIAISKLLSDFQFSHLLILIVTIIISAIFASYITIFLSKKLAKNITKINYPLLSLFILIFISIITLLLSGFLGFVVFLVSASLGIFCILSEVRRTHLMGALMLPTILFYLPF